MKCDSSHWGLENGENEKGNWKIEEEEEEEEEEEASMFLTFFVKGRMFVNFIKLSKVRIAVKLRLVLAVYLNVNKKHV